MFGSFRFRHWGLFLIIAFIGVIKKIISSLKRQAEIKYNMQNLDLTNYIQVIKSFPELNKCKEMNKKYNLIAIIVSMLIYLGAVFLFFKFFNPTYIVIFGIVGLIVLFIFSIKANSFVKLYERIYKDSVINQLLKSTDPNVVYIPKAGISKTQYDYGNFEKYDTFLSEDMIKSSIDNTPFVLSDVTAKEKYIDRNGHIRYETVFSGTVAIANLPKNINAFVNILDNRRRSERNQYYVQIDNTEFENKYDVFSNNNIIAMRLLTPNITMAILDLQKQTNLKMEIKIGYSTIYFRFFYSNLFEPAMKNEKLEAYLAYESILKYKTIREIINEILKAINELD